MDYLSLAIQKLKPKSEYVYFGDDYSTIQWIVLDGNPPTQNEIDQAIKQIKADKVSEIKANAEAKAALLNRLGITEDEAKLLLS